MAARKKVLGIQVSIQPLDKRYVAPGDSHWYATFTIGEGFPARDFLSNVEIRDAIQRTGLAAGELLGNIHMAYYSYSNTLMFGEFSPLEKVEGSAKFARFEKRGIASLLEYRVLEKMHEHYPTATLYHDPNDLRRTQLKSRGVTEMQLESGYTIGEGLALLRAKIAQGVKKRVLRSRARVERPKRKPFPRRRGSGK